MHTWHLTQEKGYCKVLSWLQKHDIATTAYSAAQGFEFTKSLLSKQGEVTALNWLLSSKRVPSVRSCKLLPDAPTVNCGDRISHRSVMPLMSRNKFMHVSVMAGSTSGPLSSQYNI